MDDHICRGIQDCPGSECPFYPSLVQMLQPGQSHPQDMADCDFSETPSTDEYFELFHAYCTDCLGAETIENTLCCYCRHLRLRHPFNCLTRQQPERYPLVNLGPLWLLRSRETCNFCNMVVNLFRTDSPSLLDEDYVLVCINTGTYSQHIQRAIPETIGSPELVLFQSDLDPLGYGYTNVHYARILDNLSADSAEHSTSPSWPDVIINEYVDWSKPRLWLQECCDLHDHSHESH